MFYMYANVFPTSFIQLLRSPSLNGQLRLFQNSFQITSTLVQTVFRKHSSAKCTGIKNCDALWTCTVRANVPKHLSVCVKEIRTDINWQQSPKNTLIENKMHSARWCKGLWWNCNPKRIVLQIQRFSQRATSYMYIKRCKGHCWLLFHMWMQRSNLTSKFFPIVCDTPEHETKST